MSYFTKLRASEFKRLDRQNQVYLDYNGAGVYPSSLVREHQKLLCHLLGNPHSTSPSSTLSSHLIEQTRTHILHFFNADPRKYTVVFTANATAAIKLVAEGYPFRRGSTLVLSADNHTSVNGIQEYAKRAGATIRIVPLDQDFRLINSEQNLRRWRKTTPGLFAFPAQSNFTGVKHPLDLVDMAHKYGYDVLLDAASFAPTSKLDLSQSRPDFACVSFYKMFGYPTGLGVLIANKMKLKHLKRPWFSGGTVNFVSTLNGSHYPAEGPARFEDGTPNFLSIPAVTSGLDFLNEVGMGRLTRHIAELTGYLLKGLKDIRYGNGSRMIVVYGPQNLESRGGIVAFDVVRKDGSRVDATEVDRFLKERCISVRMGLLCNPGCAEYAYGLEKGTLGSCLKQLHKVTPERVSECLGVTNIGSIRVSLGVSSVVKDIKALLGVLREFCAELAEQDMMTTSNPERKSRGISFDVQPKRKTRRLSIRRRHHSAV